MSPRDKYDQCHVLLQTGSKIRPKKRSMLHIMFICQSNKNHRNHQASCSLVIILRVQVSLLLLLSVSLPGSRIASSRSVTGISSRTSPSGWTSSLCLVICLPILILTGWYEDSFGRFFFLILPYSKTSSWIFVAPTNDPTFFGMLLDSLTFMNDLCCIYYNWFVQNTGHLQHENMI